MLQQKQLPKISLKHKAKFIQNYILSMTNLSQSIADIEIDDGNFWDTYFTIRNFMEQMPTDENALGFSLFDKEKLNQIPLFITKYNAGVKVLNFGVGAGTKIKRLIDKGRFRTLNDKVFLLDVELYKSLIEASKKWSSKYREKITTSDGREVMAVYPFDQRKLGKLDEEFVIEQMFEWLDQRAVLEIIKKKFNLIEVK